MVTESLAGRPNREMYSWMGWYLCHHLCDAHENIIISIWINSRSYISGTDKRFDMKKVNNYTNSIYLCIDLKFTVNHAMWMKYNRGAVISEYEIKLFSFIISYDDLKFNCNSYFFPVSHIVTTLIIIATVVTNIMRFAWRELYSLWKQYIIEFIIVIFLCIQYLWANICCIILVMEALSTSYEKVYMYLYRYNLCPSFRTHLLRSATCIVKICRMQSVVFGFVENVKAIQSVLSLPRDELAGNKKTSGVTMP